MPNTLFCADIVYVGTKSPAIEAGSTNSAESPHVFWRVTLIEVNRVKNVMPKVNGKNQNMTTEWFLDLFYHLFF
jgi:hypothetical protein